MATVSELIIQRQNDVSKDWQSFLEHPVHRSIGEVIPRENTQPKADFVPWAPGVVIASDYLLRRSGHTPTSRRPPRWRKHRRWGYFMKGALIVRKRSDFWFVEMAGASVLVFRYGSMPVCTRTYQAAMRLAQYFLSLPTLPPPVHGLRWVLSKPDGILSC